MNNKFTEATDIIQNINNLHNIAWNISFWENKFICRLKHISYLRIMRKWLNLELFCHNKTLKGVPW